MPLTRAMRLRRLFPPSGPRYELLDSSLAVCWICAFGYVIFPTPALAKAALGAPFQIVTEQQLGLAIVVLTGVACMLAFVRPFTLHGHRITPVKIGYQLSRTAVLFMALNFTLSAILVTATLWGPFAVPSTPEARTAEMFGLRSSLIFGMFYSYIFRRLKRDNRPVV